MRTAFVIIVWSLVGCILAPILVYSALCLYANWARSFNSSDWSPLIWVLVSPWLGFVLGGIYGDMRSRYRRGDMRTALVIIGWSLVGGVILPLVIYIFSEVVVYVNWVGDANGNSAWLVLPGWSLLLSPWLGLVLGASYGIMRSRYRPGQ
jgi:hypothetical protein